MAMQTSQYLTQFVLHYRGNIYPLNKPQWLIGRDNLCDICVQDNSQVLAMHAQIISQGGQVFVEAMAPEALLWVNGAPVSRQTLKANDEIVLGSGGTRLLVLAAEMVEQQTLANGPFSSSPAAFPGPESVQEAPAETRSSAANWSVVVERNSMPAQEQRFTTGARTGQLQGSALREQATETTRYLCATAYTNEAFQAYVIATVVGERHKAQGESYGVDMPLVVSWCFAALQRKHNRDLLLVALTFLIPLALLLALILFIHGVGVGVGSSSFGLLTGLLTGALLIGLVISCFVLFLVYAFLNKVFKIEEIIKRRWPAAHPGVIAYFAVLLLVLLEALNGQVFLLLVFLLVSLIPLTVFGELMLRFYGQEAGRLRRGSFNPRFRPVPLSNELDRRLSLHFSPGLRNVVAYSGYNPFQGAGVPFKAGSLTVDTSQGGYDRFDKTASERLSPLPFTMNDLYQRIEKDMWALGLGEVLEIDEKLYVHGKHLPEKPLFFNSSAMCPVTSVDASTLARYRENPEEDVRYYQCLRFTCWRGEVILTVFLRFIQRGKNLFTEFEYFLLPPVKPLYRLVDTLEEMSPFQRGLRLFVQALSSAYADWRGVLRYFFRRRKRLSFWQRLLALFFGARRWDPAFDYGARHSLRFFVSDDDPQLFFQHLDVQMYAKIAERQILDSLIAFLDEHQIDTGALREQEQTILNNNTYNNGPINNTGFMVTGSGSQMANNVPHAPMNAQGGPAANRSA